MSIRTMCIFLIKHFTNLPFLHFLYLQVIANQNKSTKSAIYQVFFLFMKKILSRHVVSMVGTQLPVNQFYV